MDVIEECVYINTMIELVFKRCNEEIVKKHIIEYTLIEAHGKNTP